MIEAYTQRSQARMWLERYRSKSPVFTCVLGFTATGLLPGISAAGATPEARKVTAIADAEFLSTGKAIHFPLPSLVAGVSPVMISRAVIAELDLPYFLFSAGLPALPMIEIVDLGGSPANCISTGEALPLATVKHLWQQGLTWGEKLAQEGDYLLLSECVVGGTTTALAVLTALGIDARAKVNSSHPTCNHAQKWQLVKDGLKQFRAQNHVGDMAVAKVLDPFEAIAAVGDPMQAVVAGMAISASRSRGVLLAGGTQMLAVYALARAIAERYEIPWMPTQIVVGTTRWVAEDPTGDTVGLAELIGDVPLLATQLSFANSRYPQLRAYEQGFVKEGVGAGGAAIASHLYGGWTQDRLLAAIEKLLDHSYA